MGWLLDTFAWLTDPQSWQGSRGIPTLLVEHLGLTAASLGLACLIGLPLAVWLGHVGRGGVLAVQVGNIGRAVPTLALLTILVLASAPFGRSTLTQLVAFTAFAIPPILTNTYVGMRDVDREVVDAARGMGMTGSQVLRRVELPLATTMLMTGVRIAAVQLFATVSIAAIVGFGGLGRIVTNGFALRDVGQVVGGAMVIAALALLVELVFEQLSKVLDPRRRADSRPAPRTPEPVAPLP